MLIELGDLVKVKIPTDKSISFFQSDTSIGEIVGIKDTGYTVEIGDNIHEIRIEDIVGKVEKLSKSKHCS